MADRSAQTTVEPSRLSEASPREGAAAGPPLSQRVFSLRNIVSVFLTLLMLYLVYRQVLGLDWQEVWTTLQGASPVLFALSLMIFYWPFPLRALRWKTLLANVGYGRADGRPMPAALGLTRIMYLAWFANCVTLARLGNAYRSFLLKREAGVSFALTLGTVLAERLLDLVVMAAMMGAGVLVVFGHSLPTGALQALAAGLILSAVGIVGLLAMRRFRWAFERILPERLHASYTRLEHGTLGSFRRLPLLVALSAVGWLLEGAALYAVAAAVGGPVSVAGALVVALAASLLTTVPITPAGLGFTEVGMVVMLGWMGVDVTTATAATLLFRLINYWSIVVLGFVLYVFGYARDRLTKERLGTSGEFKKVCP